MTLMTSIGPLFTCSWMCVTGGGYTGSMRRQNEGETWLVHCHFKNAGLWFFRCQPCQATSMSRPKKRASAEMQPCSVRGER